jgi:FkbM family methyltransferase
MDKIYRDGADIEVAFSSSSRRNAIAAISEGADVLPQHDAKGQTGIPDEALMHVGAGEAAIPSGPVGYVKRLLRPVARRIYRSLKPFLAPVAFRTRSYLMHSSMEQLQHTHALTLQKLAESEAALHSEMRASHAAIRAELQENHILMQDEVDAVRIAAKEMRSLCDVLRRDALSVRELAQRRDEEDKAYREKRNEEDKAYLDAGFKNIYPLLERIENYACVAARRVAAYCGPNEILVRTAVGYMLCPSTDHALLAQLLETGELEPGTRLLIERIMKTGHTYVDVGANIGMHVLAAARAMRGQGRIICFEPFPETSRLLEKSVWINGYAGQVSVHNAGVSDRPGRQPLFLGQTSGHHSLFPLASQLASAQPPVEVDLVRLDDALPGNAQVDLIKIDVEGAEIDALAGSVATISRNPDIGLIVEFGASHLQRSSHAVAEWLGHFERLGLSYMAINPETGALEALPPYRLAQTDSVNLFFARTGSTAWQKAAAINE